MQKPDDAAHALGKLLKYCGEDNDCGAQTQFGMAHPKIKSKHLEHSKFLTNTKRDSDILQ